MSNLYSFYPYKVRRDLEVTITNLKIDGERNDGLIRNQKLYLNDNSWTLATFNIKIKTSGYEDLFDSKEKQSITCIVTLDCIKTQFRNSISETAQENKTEFNIEMKIYRRDISGKASLDAFIIRNQTNETDYSKYANTTGQRISVQGEEDHYWSILVDDPELSGNDIDVEYISFKDDKDFGLNDKQDSLYSLKKIASSRPKLLINIDFKYVVEIWDPKNQYTKIINKKEKAFRRLLNRVIGRDIKLQLSVQALTDAYSSGEFEEGSSEGFKENLVKEWMMILDPNADSREIFLAELHENGLSKLVSRISKELTNDLTKGEEINKFARVIK